MLHNAHRSTLPVVDRPPRNKYHHQPARRYFSGERPLFAPSKVPFRTTTAQRHDGVYFRTTKGTKATKGAFQIAISHQPSAFSQETANHQSISVLIRPARHSSSDGGCPSVVKPFLFFAFSAISAVSRFRRRWSRAAGFATARGLGCFLPSAFGFPPTASSLRPTA
jgi:hypothetical protein